MKGSLRLVTFAGIPVRIHWTFGLLLGWVVIYAVSSGLSLSGSLIALAVLMVLFVCVVMHEYGHALTARRFGVETQDILLSPIGGLARLSHIPENPLKEMAIAIAGPLVNLAIASLLLLLIWTIGNESVHVFSAEFWDWDASGSLLVLIAKVNLILMLFNLIPAFPMDGGRIFRALLCLSFPRLSATMIASGLGQLFGLVLISSFVYEQITGNPVQVAGVVLSGFITALIGGFVILAARAELRQTRLKERLKTTRVADVMTFHDTLLHPATTVGELARTEQHVRDFLVGSNGEVGGVLFHEAVRSTIQSGDLGTPVGQLISNLWEPVGSEMSLLSVVKLFRKEGYRIVPVIDNAVLKGTLTRSDLLEIVEK